MQINRRANMMLDQLIKGQIKPVSSAAIQGSFLWATALLSATTAIYFCYQAYHTPADPLWAAQEYQMVAQADEIMVEATPEHDDITENLVFADLDEAMLVNDQQEEATGTKALDPVIFETVETEALEEIGTVETVESKAVDSFETVPDWLEEHEGFTVQVLATPDESEANRTATQYSQAHVLHAARQNKPTYIVLVGEFDSFSNAKEAVSKLSEEHAGVQPWVRRYSQLRDDVAHLKDIE